ncbi:MAG TPA: 3-hydroxyisobutyrate dehydrogenase [Janthinobacterium sp.]|nr:3-hydroxyisobutyrate dehydrogenase [Janthinobacterium sp.]
MKFASLQEPNGVAATDLSPELLAARLPIENYLNGHVTGRAAYMRAAFHPDARIMSFREGKLFALTVEEFAARFQGQAAADEAQRRRRIECFEIRGNAGSAKVVLEYPEVTFTDYMTLLEIDGQWKITNKTFSAGPALD